MEEQPTAAVPSPMTAEVASTAVSGGHTFPPSPPSSCGGQSPPLPKTAQETLSLLSPSASAEAQPPPPPTRPSSLPFSIENILRPDFGSHDQRVSVRPTFTSLSPDAILRTPPKSPEQGRSLIDTPVDLSHKKTTTTRDSPQSQAPTVNHVVQSPASSTTSSSNSSSSSSRTRYPENPEELANPRVPQDEMIWPAWVYCTRYSDRPSSGPRSRRMKRRDRNPEEKRPRTAFTSEQLSRLKVEFEQNKYLTEKRRQELAKDLGLNESQIKIWFQNKRAKIKKASGPKNGLAQHLMAQGLYNHSTMPVDEDDPYLN